MTEQKFTIIIPTKNRADVLYWALKTCVEQQYKNLDIIVSDNFSDDNTKEVALSFNDPRIRYINTGEPLSMSGNWEFSLAHVQEGFVTYLGDDDAFLPGAITAVNKIANETGADAINAACIEYNWPSHTNPLYRNKLFFIKNNIDMQPDAKALLPRALRSEVPYSVLPWLYKGFVSMALLKKIKDRSGNFFHSRTPDVYSAVAIGSVIAKDKYYYSKIPFAINGASSHSNGVAQGAKIKNAGALEYVSSLSIPFHKDLVLCNSFPIYVFECYLQARDAGIIDANDHQVKLEEVLKNAMEQIQYSDKETYDKLKNAVTEMAKHNHLSDQKLHVIFQKYPNRNKISKFMSKARNRYFSDIRQIDMNAYDVQNVYDAALIADKILKKEIKPDASKVISTMVKDIRTIFKNK